MKYTKHLALCAGLLGFLLASGCAGTPIHIPAVSAADVDEDAGRPITASASGFQLLLFFPISINGRHARAWEALQAQAGDDAIADVRIVESWVYALVGTVYKTELQATAYPRRK